MKLKADLTLRRKKKKKNSEIVGVIVGITQNKRF